MDIRYILLVFCLVYLFLICCVFTAPVDPNKKTDEEQKSTEEKKIESEIDNLVIQLIFINYY